MFPKELYDFLMLMGTALVAFVVCQRIRTSLAIGYLLSGILLGPLGVGLFTKNLFFNTLSQVGILLFLFTVGLEIPFHRIRALRKYIFGLGLAQVALTSIGLTTLLSFFIPLSAAIILGLSLSFSSTAVVVQLLSERFELTSYSGRTALSILLFQDIVAILIFVYLGLVSSVNQSLWQVLGKSAFGMIMAILSGIALAKITERVLARYRYSEFITAFVILTVLGMSLVTEWFHLSSELGAFIVGMAMASTHWRHQISAELHPFRTLFLAIFFITMGLEIQQWPSLSSTGWILTGLVGIIGFKALVIRCCAHGFGLQGGWSLGLLMGGCSEFLFMILPLMEPSLGQPMTNNLLVMGFLSMILTPFLFFAHKKWITPPALGETPLKESPAVMIAGFGHVGQTIARILEQNFVSFVVADYDGAVVEKAKEAGIPVIHGDIRDIEFLKRLRVFEAKVLLITFGHLLTTVELVRTLRRKFPHLSICIQVRDYNEATRFAGLGAHVIVPEAIESGMHMASLTLQFLGFSPDYAEKMIHFPQNPMFLGARK